MKEGSFEGLMSGFQFTTENEEVKNIQTPDQVPAQMNLSQVPEHILRSNVIESLIAQNDDLMARLNVSLRRIAILEEKISDANQVTEQYKAKYENIKDQILVLREQSRVIAERAKETESKIKKDSSEFQALEEQIKLLEIRYAELYTSSSQKENRLHNANESLMRQLLRYSKYRDGVKRAVQNLKKEVQLLRAKNVQYESQVADLRSNVAETTAYISNQAKEHKKDLADLTQNYEETIRELRAQIVDLTGQNKILTERSIDADKLFQQKVQLENDLIIAERREENIKVQTATEIADLQKTLVRYRNDSKEMALENARLTEELNEANATTHKFKSENMALSEQVENLQHLWREQQNQVEKLNSQKVSLQKLNQELSITINQMRKETRELREKLDAQAIENKFAPVVHTPSDTIDDDFEESVQKVKEILKATNTAEDGSAVGAAIVVGSGAKEEEKTQDAPATKADGTADLMSKIDKALSDLHFGH